MIPAITFACLFTAQQLLSANSTWVSPGVALDVHMHAFSPSSWSKEVKAENIIDAMDEVGVRQAVVISSGYFEGFWRLFLSSPLFGRSVERVRTENNYVANIVRSHPDRLIGACGVHPFDEWAQTEMVRCVQDLGFRVVKVHPNAQRIDLTSNRERQRLKAYLESVGKSGAVVLMHAFGKGLEFQKREMSLAMDVTGTTFILAHMFGEDFREVVESMKQPIPSNIFVDISGTVVEDSNPEQLAATMRKFGLDHLLFGSDYPTFTPKATLEALRKLRLTPDEMSRILSNIGPFGKWVHGT